MRKSLWYAAGVTVLLFANPLPDAHAEISVTITKVSKPAFVIDSRPVFVKPANLGFSIASAGFYDLISYNNRYYLYYNNAWYRSSNYRGPWSVIRAEMLPLKIRKQSISEIRISRDNEMRKLKNRTNLLKQQTGQ
ncbi:hypothetical protein [Chlorobium ferrooxidans]|uniref:Uncharacterized protein n=1 Tax=Chlorobium ferrooxidans DSM 13031 TaxID=377431 RepID=Q0YPG5_9CHLB|nr:hypothetical protein [Chlorobium ferrooxidans]EAT58182.1 conserved hypothetical protein [Chlorobium ferrooxidans DSM 13031]